MMTTPIMILLSFIAALAILLVLFFLYLLITKLFDNRKRKKQSELTNRIVQALVGQVKATEETFRDMAAEKNFLSATTDALREFNRNIEVKTDGANTLYLKNVLTPILLQELKSSKESVRINALQVIERFYEQFETAPLWEHANTNNPGSEEKLLILKIALQNDDAHAIELIKGESDRYSFYTNKQLVRRFRTETLKRAYKSFDEWPLAFQLALLSYIAEERQIDQLPLAERLLTTDQVEMKIQAIKCIKEIGYTTVPEQLHSFAQSSDWREQLLFAQTAQVIRQESFIPLLKPLLESSNWQVRYNAGQALIAFESGLVSLREVAATTSDAYARDMAVQWLERKGEKLA